jgi:phospholipid/cholesterol/gamma-HCH transport system substrate-binding protein
METRAKFALIGLFTICVIAAAFGFIFWFSGSRAGADRKSLQVVFDTPVTGLSQGAAVLFNGIRVGEVADLSFDDRNPNLVVARVDILAKVPITLTTRARLEFSGLTGVASVQLYDTGPRSPDRTKRQDEEYIRLRAEPSPSLQTALEAFQSTVGKVNAILDENRAPIHETVLNIERLSAALDADRINTAVKNISDIAAKLDVDKFNHMIGSIDAAVSAVDGDTVKKILSETETFTKALSDNSGRVGEIAQNAAELVDRLKGAAATIDDLVKSNTPAVHEAIANLDKILAGIDPDKVSRTLEGLDKFATMLGNHSDEIADVIGSARTVGKALADSSDDIRAFAKNAVELVDKLKTTATDIDSVVSANSGPLRDAIASADKILASIDPAKIGRTVDGLDKFSTTLGNHSAEVGDFIKDAKDLAASLNRVSAQVEAFMNSGAPGSLTRSLANIEDITKQIDSAKLGEIVDNVKKFAAALGNNSPRVDEIAKNANELFAKLNRSADKVDDILKGVGSLVSSPEGKSAFAEFADAMRSVRKLADDLDKRSAELLVNLTKFSGSGLRDFQQFAIDGRHTLGDISRTLQSVQRNPQQFIFGGKAALPQYGN